MIILILVLAILVALLTLALVCACIGIAKVNRLQRQWLDNVMDSNNDREF